MNTRRILVGFVVLAAAASLLAAVRYRHRADAQVTPGATAEKLTLHFFRNPSVVPAFTARDLDGRTMSSADWRGKVILVNFWATWCPPCRAEIPALIALQEKYRDRLQIIGVSEDEGSPDLVRRFVADQHMNYPVVMNTPELGKLFPGVAALPTSFVLDREARLVQKHVGLLQPILTEQETRALAGLAVNASIEEIDRSQGLKLENAARVLDIPGIEIRKLPADRRVAVVQKLNTESCTCGCDLTVAKCRVDDPNCGISLPIARRIVEEIGQ